MGSGSLPAFIPAVDDSVAPVSGLQRVYLDDYALKKYAPTIMHLHHFTKKDEFPVYYSFQVPTTMFFFTKIVQDSKCYGRTAGSKVHYRKIINRNIA